MLKKFSMSLCCMALLFLLLATGVGCTVTLFDDVYSDDWYARNVYALQDKNIITGFPDNTFRGEDNITRAEFITMVMKTNEALTITTNVTQQSNFTDISTTWAQEFIESAFSKGLVKGYPDGTFDPDGPITREEAFTIIYNLIKLNNKNLIENNITDFTDQSSISDFALNNIIYLHSTGIVVGYSDNSVQPKDNITRGETTSLFMKTLQLSEYTGDIGNATRPIVIPEPVETLTPLGTYKITFYCTGGCCGSSSGMTASGKYITPYKTVAMKGIAFGTRIKIEFSRADLQYLNGEYIVEDRGVGYGVVDVALPYHSLCNRLGVDRGAQVYIIE